MVPGEVCAECPERDNHYREVVLNVQKSAEAVVVKGNGFHSRGRAESTGVFSTTGKGGKNIGCRKQRKLLAKR